MLHPRGPGRMPGEPRHADGHRDRRPRRAAFLHFTKAWPEVKAPRGAATSPRRRAAARHPARPRPEADHGAGGRGGVQLGQAVVVGPGQAVSSTTPSRMAPTGFKEGQALGLAQGAQDGGPPGGQGRGGPVRQLCGRGARAGGVGEDVQIARGRRASKSRVSAKAASSSPGRPTTTVGAQADSRHPGRHLLHRRRELARPIGRPMAASTRSQPDGGADAGGGRAGARWPALDQAGRELATSRRRGAGGARRGRQQGVHSPLSSCGGSGPSRSVPDGPR